jgi:hypothetical protein
MRMYFKRRGHLAVNEAPKDWYPASIPPIVIVEQQCFFCSPLVSVQNLKRVAEVWMDEYAEYIYQRRPEYRHLSAGDMTVQKDLRNSLNCKSFKWFMTEVAWDLPKHYPPVEPPAAAWGEVHIHLLIL